MDRYSSPRPMMAAKINEVVRETADGKPAVLLKLDDGSVINVGEAFAAQYGPEAGGYYVQYADFHTMYQPAAYFEANHQKL